MKASIWTIEGRFERIKQKVTGEKLEFLKNKRNRQLTRLIEKYKKSFPAKVKRWQDKLLH